MIASGYRFAWECYLKEPASEPLARKHLQRELTAGMSGWQRAFPGCEPRAIICFGYMSQPPESLNANPQVDYKVWMDMQFQHLATDPAFVGLGGLMEYTSGYADEETVRWAAKLFRHYGIEGKRELLSKEHGYRYQLDHIVNADFTDGTEGWTVAPAAEGSIATRSVKGFGWLEGRYPPTQQGDTVLWMKRSAAKPNRVAQEVKGLKPGKLYSLKLFTADYRDLQDGKSAEQKHAVTIRLDGVELLPEKCFQHVFPECYSHDLGPFNRDHRFYMNYHVRVFRAKSGKAMLAISDWAGTTDPGGTVGQELILNFAELQPYLPD